MLSKEEVSKVVSGMKHNVYSFHTLGISKFSHIFGIHTYSRQTKECKLQQQEQQQKASWLISNKPMCLKAHQNAKLYSLIYLNTKCSSAY